MCFKWKAKGQEESCKKKSQMKAALTARQQTAMKRHAEHHSKKHMTEMRKAMKSGKSFTQAHKAALKKVGK